MAFWHRFTLIALSLNDEQVEVIKDSVLLLYYPKDKILQFNCKYFTGNTINRLGISMKEKKKLKLKITDEQYHIKLLREGDEQTKGIKNLGAGALFGVVVAGPVGAAIGAYAGSNRKDCPCKIIIKEPHIKIDALATVGYMKEHSKNEFFEK